MPLQPNEIRDITRLLEQGKPLPDKYRFTLFGDKREVELVWNGKTDEVTNVILPFQTIEHIDEPREESERIKLQKSLFDTSGRQIKGWTNKLIWGDNKLILSALKNGPMRKEIEDAGGIKLIYIDPPFDVGADFSMNIEIGDEEFTKKPSVIEEVAYRDTWGRGADSFIAMMYERLRLMHDLLADDGSIYVHCDSRVSAYLKLILDETFGPENKRAEIIWKRSAAHNDSKSYGSIHDTIHYYTKAENHIWNQTYTEYEEDYVDQYYRYKDPDGRRWKSGDVTAPGGRGPKFEWNGHVRNWRYTKENMQLHHDAGKLFYTSNGIPRLKQYMDEMPGVPTQTLWIDKKVQAINSWHQENEAYPTQKPEALLERIIAASSNDGDLVADFFMGSGTTLAVAEKLGRKWIGSDLGRFGIHASRKRMIAVQRQLKKEGKSYRAFEILNLGKYERKQFTQIEGDLQAEEKERVRRKKEDDFKTLILSAYKAEPLSGFRNFIGKKRDRLVAVGPIEYPVSHSFVQAIIEECREKGVTKADVLGFDYEMGFDFADAKKFGIDVQFKVIPNEVFDKRAVERGQVKFFDVAFIEVKPVIKKSTVAIELTNFSVFYNQDDIAEVEENLKGGATKIVLENGHIIKLSKDKQTDLVTREVLTQKWTDWIDYWAVDFDYESRKEFIRTPKGATDKNPLAEVGASSMTGEYDESWTGGYIFENEWQSFRTRKNRELDLTSAFKEVAKGRRKIAVKVIDIFGNDTTKVIEVNV